MKIYAALATFLLFVPLCAEAGQVGYAFGDKKFYKVDAEAQKIVEKKRLNVKLNSETGKQAVGYPGKLAALVYDGGNYSFILLNKRDMSVQKVLLDNLSDADGVPEMFVQPGGTRVVLQYMEHDGKETAVALDVATGKTKRRAVPEQERLVGFSANGRKFYSLEDGSCVSLKTVDAISGAQINKTCLAGVTSKDSWGFRYSGNDTIMLNIVSRDKTNTIRVYDAASARLVTTIPNGTKAVHEALVGSNSIIILKAKVVHLDRERDLIELKPDQSIEKYDIATGKVVGELPLKNDHDVTFAGYNPRSKKLYVVAKSGRSYNATVIDTERFTITGTIPNLDAEKIVFEPEP